MKIRIRHQEFTSPKYLVDKIKQRLNELITYSSTWTFCKMDNATLALSDDQWREISTIARRNFCQIQKIDFEADSIIISIPKAVSTSKTTSSLVLQRSHQLSSSLSMKQIPIAQGFIETHLTSQTKTIPVSSLRLCSNLLQKLHACDASKSSSTNKRTL